MSRDAAGAAHRPPLRAGAAERHRQPWHRALHGAAQPPGRRQHLHPGRAPQRPRGGAADRPDRASRHAAARGVLAHAARA